MVEVERSNALLPFARIHLRLDDGLLPKAASLATFRCVKNPPMIFDQAETAPCSLMR